MGQNLALNIAEKGFPISVYNRTTSKVDETLDRIAVEGNLPVSGQYSPHDFVLSLQRPRSLIILVKAGAHVDQTIAAFSDAVLSQTHLGCNLLPTKRLVMSLSFFQSVANGVIVSWAAVYRNRPDGHFDELIGFITAKDSEIDDLICYDSSQGEETLRRGDFDLHLITRHCRNIQKPWNSNVTLMVAADCSSMYL
uniref:6-phosphogluconate dehydrogenase NADP-binding domain-containing protein n=1 Tax=Brassica oleracea var. oleracea TaxID=109376 RepID=A0A0D3BH69_BRAOL